MLCLLSPPFNNTHRKFPLTHKHSFCVNNFANKFHCAFAVNLAGCDKCAFTMLVNYAVECFPRAVWRVRSSELAFDTTMRMFE